MGSRKDREPDSGPLAARDEDVIVLGPCPQCGTTSPVDLVTCPVCGAHVSAETGQTVLDDVHARETFLLGPRGTPASDAPSDTTDTTDTLPEVLPADPTRIVISAPSVSELPSFAESTDEEVDGVTEYKPRKPSVEDEPKEFGSSSDPPTRFLSNHHHKHIELPSGSVVDDYEIDAKIGAGAMGVVYAARHIKLGRRVAIKVIAPTMGSDPQALARFAREAQALASIHHPNIVDVHAFGTLPDRRCYFVMERLLGEPLDDRLARGRVSLDEACDVIDQIARALEVAHAQQIVHRDLKPSNCFLVRIPREQRPIVKLLDFGLVKSEATDGADKTASGIVLGTAAYCSPEQARGPDVDGRTDVYALGCMAYELVLGRHPFPDVRTALAAIAAHLTEMPPQPRTIWPGIPAALDLLLYSMLAKDPRYRPTLAQVRSVIASVRASTTIARREARSSTESPTSGALDSRAWIVALVVIALVVGIAIGARVLGGGMRAGETIVASDAALSIRMPEGLPVSASASARDTGVMDAQLAPTGSTTRSVPPPASSPQPTTTAAVKPARPSSPRPVEFGTLRVVATPNCEISVDGKPTGLRTPQTEIKLPAGRHKLTLTLGNDFKETFPIEIKANQVDTEIRDYRDQRPDGSSDHILDRMH